MAEIFDLSKKRAETVDAKTRQFERIFFQELIGCYSAIDNGDKIFPIEIIDISETGCLLEIPKSSGGLSHFEIDATVSLRLYFTKKSFITLNAKVVRSEEDLNERNVNVYRFGASFDKEARNFDVFKTFIEFVKKFAEHSHVDNSSRKVYFL